MRVSTHTQTPDLQFNSDENPQVWPWNRDNLGRSVSGRADVASALLSSRRGRQDGRIRKYCSRSTLPVEKSSGNKRIHGLSAEGG